MKLTFKSYWPGVAWFVLACVAFFIPGSALPDNQIFSLLEVDKLVHVGMFTIMIVLWYLPMHHKGTSSSRWLIRVPLIFFGYSIAVEFIQHYFIPGRSFDLADIIADAAGCLLGFIWTRWHYRTQVEAK